MGHGLLHRDRSAGDRPDRAGGVLGCIRPGDRFRSAEDFRQSDRGDHPAHGPLDQAGRRHCGCRSRRQRKLRSDPQDRHPRGLGDHARPARISDPERKPDDQPGRELVLFIEKRAHAGAGRRQLRGRHEACGGTDARSRTQFRPGAQRPAADRVDEHRLIYAGLVLLAGSTFLLGLTGSYPVLLLARIIMGIGMALFSVPALRIVSGDPESRDHSFRISLLTAAFSCGVGVGPLLTGLCAAKRFSVPLFMFIVSQCEMSADELYRQYVGKNVLNFFRQDNGYKEGTYVKVWEGREDNEHLVEVMDALDLTKPEFSDLVYEGLRSRYPS